MIQDRYLVVSRIGEGGSGMVYLVEHTRVGRRYALKVLDQTLARKPAVLARFYREARAAATVGDEHIVDVFDMGDLENGSPYMVMELLEGRDLAAALDRDGPMPIEHAIAVTHQCCYALDAAHKKGIIHRDIKPKNIFLTQRRDGSEFVKVLDFGISKILEAANDVKAGALTGTGTAIGTPHYMSVEQVDGCRDIDARTDVYAMGVVLFEMLTDRTPFDAPTYAKLVMKLVTDPPPSLVDIRADIPPELEHVVHRALAKNREERFQSMTALAEALAPFAALSQAPRLVDSSLKGVTVNRPSTPNGWAHYPQNTRSTPSRFVNAKVLVASAAAGVAILGAMYYFVFANQVTKTSTSALTLLKPAAPAISQANPAQDNHVTKAPPTESASRPTPTSPIELAEAPAASQSVQAAAERVGQQANANEAAHGAARPKQLSRDVKTQTALSQPKRLERNDLPPKPVSPSAASTLAAARTPRVAATRTVTIYNSLRTNVTVTLTCGNRSANTTVSGLRRASAVVPQESCGVNCTGAGEPVCPTLLSASVDTFDIR